MTPGFRMQHFANAANLAAAAAADIVNRLQTAAATRSSVTLALSGGRIAIPLFHHLSALLAAQPELVRRLHWFWADERAVPPEHPESNFAIARQHLFEPLQIDPGRQHRIRGELPPPEAASLADLALRQQTGATRESPPGLDLVWLGMGEDGHVASLFPNGSVELPYPTSAYGFVRNAPKPPPVRITLTWQALTAANHILVLVAGPGKASALQRALQGDTSLPLGQLLRLRPDSCLYVEDVAPDKGSPPSDPPVTGK